MKLLMATNIYGVGRTFKDCFDDVEYVGKHELDDIDPHEYVLCLEGGEDIAASIYHQKSVFGENKLPSTRDRYEMNLYQKFRGTNGIIAICRGAQLACALEGGALYQHVYNHAGEDHLMRDQETGEQFLVSSAHHQMMDLRDIDPDRFLLLGVANPNRSGLYHTDEDVLEEVPNEPEAVWFGESKCLAIQFHPEFMNEADRAVEWSKEKVREFLL